MIAQQQQRTKQRLIIQSGVIPYRIRRGRVEIALVTARSGPHWTVPKGHVEADMRPEESAAKEALEESGLLGEIGRRCVGRYVYEKAGALRRVDLYPLLVMKEKKRWPEMHERQRKWMNVDDAVKRVIVPELRRTIQDFARMILRSSKSERRAAAA